MHILEKCFRFTFCQRRRPAKDQPMPRQIFAMEKQLVEQQPLPVVRVPGFRRISLQEGVEEYRRSRRASHSPAHLETMSTYADVHQPPPDVVPVPRPASSSSKRNSGIAIENDIEVMASCSSTLPLWL